MTYSIETDHMGAKYTEHPDAKAAAAYVASIAGEYADMGHRVQFDGRAYYIPTAHLVLSIVTLAA